MDLKIKEFIDNMEYTTKKILAEYKDLEGHNAVSLDFYDDIGWHLEDLGLKDDVDKYNVAYEEIEKAYMDYLKSL